MKEKTTKYGLLSLLVFLPSCTAPFQDRIQRGPLSWEEVKIHRTTSPSSYEIPGQQRVYTYEGESFQVKEGQVNYYYRKPKRREKKLSYWMERWKNHVYHFAKVEESPKTHGHKLQTLHYINYDTHERFLYDPSSREVTQVIFELTLSAAGRKDKMNSRWALLTLIPLLFISLFFFERRVLQKQPWESKNLSRLESLRGYPPVPSHRTLASQQSQGQRKKPPCAWERFTREEVRKEIPPTSKKIA